MVGRLSSLSPINDRRKLSTRVSSGIPTFRVDSGVTITLCLDPVLDGGPWTLSSTTLVRGKVLNS